MTILRRRTLVQIALAMVVGALAVRYVRALDVRALVAAVSAADRRLLLICVLLNVPLVLCKACRLRRLSGTSASTPRLMGLYFASYAADNLLMSQAGLGVRVALLCQDGVALGRAVSAQAVEKACEAVGLGALAACLIGQTGWIARPLLGCLVAAAASGVVVVAVAALPRPAHPRLERLTSAARELRSPTVALEVMAATLAAWALEVALAAIALRACGIWAPALPTAALVLVAVNMAALLPGLPANLGTFEMACVMVLRAARIPTDLALAFALLYHAAHTVPVTLLGLVSWRGRR